MGSELQAKYQKLAQEYGKVNPREERRSGAHVEFQTAAARVTSSLHDDCTVLATSNKCTLTVLAGRLPVIVGNVAYM